MLKVFLLILAVLAHTIISAPLSYLGTWNVYQGCTGRYCCCPLEGAKVKLESGGPDKTVLSMVTGDFNSNCDQFAWRSSGQLELPWDDNTIVDNNIGIETTYTLTTGKQVHWIYYPVIGEAERTNAGITKGEKVVSITMEQDEYSCAFILYTNQLKLTLGLLLVIFFAVFLY